MEKGTAKYFKGNNYRDRIDKLVVSLPFADEPTKLKELKMSALRRYLAIERSMGRDPQFKALHSAFMEEHLQFGHLEEVDFSKNAGSPQFSFLTWSFKDC